MELLVSLALLVVGLIIGFFIGRFVQTKTGGNSAAQTEQQVKEILAQQAQHHIHQTRQSLEGIESQCETLKQQIDTITHPKLGKLIFRLLKYFIE